MTDVNKIILLPDEKPVVLTVNDKDKVNQQKFFKNTQNGDKVLVFSNQGRAILYRPSDKKIIEVGLVDLSALKAQNKQGDTAN